MNLKTGDTLSINEKMTDAHDSCFPSVDLDLEYSDDESTTLCNTPEGRNKKVLPPAPNSIIVDELEINQTGFIRNQHAKMKTDSLSCIPATPNSDVTACPCCLSYIQCTETKRNSNYIIPCNHTDEQKSYFASLMGKVRSDENRQNRSQEHASKTFASASLEYEIKSVLMESWMEKKGSGLDIFGNKSWKSRWCQLVSCHVPGFQVDVPVLLVSWHYSMPLPSTIIVLDEKLAISKHHEDKTKFCFDVVAKEKPVTKMMARTFSVSTSEERDEWIQGINKATQLFHKARKAYLMKETPLPPTSPKSNAQSNISIEGDLEGLSLSLE